MPSFDLAPMRNEDDGLENNLTTSPVYVRNEYNLLSLATGPLFRQGDEISAEQFSLALNSFQQLFIQTVQMAKMAVQALTLNISMLYSQTDVFRGSNISAMTGLYQRVNVRRPIPRLLETGEGNIMDER